MACYTNMPKRTKLPNTLQQIAARYLSILKNNYQHTTSGTAKRYSGGNN